MVEAGPGPISAHLVAFSRALGQAGIAVTPGRTIEAARALTLIDITHAQDVRGALRATLATSVEDFAAFDELFDYHWLGRRTIRPRQVITPAATVENRPQGPPVYALRPLRVEGVDAEGDVRLPGAPNTGSETDILTRKDFKDFDAADTVRARRLIRQLRPRLATVRSRRSEPAGSGQVDLRRTVVASQRRGGETIDLLHRRQRREKLCVVALLDVSGSMDRYSPHLLSFFAALQAEAGAGVRTFVFSTRLHDVTSVLRRPCYDTVLRGLGAAMNAWSGGTSIGGCLAQFNAAQGRALVGPRTVVIIASDGWERGDVERLRGEMRLVARRARSVVWLNPLKAREGYEPLAKGMAAALPFVDHFLPAESMASLERLKRVLLD